MNHVVTSDTIAHSDPNDRAHYERAARSYAARSLAELAHERMIQTFVERTTERGSLVRVPTDSPDVAWRFVGQPRLLDYWHVEPDSIRRFVAGQAQDELDPLQLFLDLRNTIGISASTLSRFVEESLQTIYGDMCILRRGRPAASVLADAEYRTVEAAMEGHPWLLINKGRVGFNAQDVLRYAPEHGQTQRLLWFAAHRERAAFHGMEGDTEAAHYTRELGTEELASMRAQLEAGGHRPEEYVFLPVHEWQWRARLQTLFAGEIATGRLVPLRVSADSYFPQQSIRTFVNAERRDRCCVKTTLSVLNTGQYRGLNPDKLALAPKMTGWMRSRLASDPLLRELGFGMLGEVATVSYRHPSFDPNREGPYQYREMLGALWREHPLGQLRTGERMMTMAALLYADDKGIPLVGAMAYRAGVTLEAWIKAYLHAYLTPLLHCFFKHETYFVAHGENTMLVLLNDLPKRVVLKDFVEEVQVSQDVRGAMSPEFRAVLGDFEEELIPLFVLTDVFDGFFRYLSDVLVTHAAWPEPQFWQLAANVIRDYQARFPELMPQYRRFDLFCAEFPRFCLNKYRLVYHGYADANASSWESNLRFSGTLPNPIAPFAG